MHRNRIISLLENYREHNKAEEQVVEKFLSFVRLNKDCFERSLKIGHITGSGWLVSLDNSKVLLTHHKNLNKWMQLGGHADGDSNVLNVALREVQEESGIMDVQPISENIFDIDAHIIPTRKSEMEHIHFDIRFAFKVKASEEFIVSDESHDLAWIEIDKVEEYSKDESILRMVRKWKTQNYHL